MKKLHTNNKKANQKMNSKLLLNHLSCGHKISLFSFLRVLTLSLNSYIVSKNKLLGGKFNSPIFVASIAMIFKNLKTVNYFSQSSEVLHKDFIKRSHQSASPVMTTGQKKNYLEHPCREGLGGAGG